MYIIFYYNICATSVFATICKQIFVTLPVFYTSTALTANCKKSFFGGGKGGVTIL